MVSGETSAPNADLNKQSVMAEKTKIKHLKDPDKDVDGQTIEGERFYPYTHENAVVMADGDTLHDKLNHLAAEHQKVVDFVDDAPNTYTTKTELQTLDLKVGDLARLETSAKDNLVDAINEAAQGGGGELGYEENFVMGEDVYIGEAEIGDDGESLIMPTAEYDEEKETITIK